MDYERAYKAVLKTATQWIKDGCTDKEKICLESVFPELRESEDERIRKDIVASVEMRGDLTQGRKSEIYAYLERQKENPQSADSISSDCVSDAKCEDRWHKVGDSLPDNPREVLCKDEAGNYFIGRYYVGEGWEISNYDDEDKPHHLNPPVSKWIDFPSEKQKEQKPVEWSEEDRDRVAQYLHDRDGGMLWSKATEITSDILDILRPRPSWKPTEDEERLINTSISFLKDFADKGYENAVECIDWLKSKLNGNPGK